MFFQKNKKSYSIIRKEEYDRLSGLSLDGKILDLGGSTKSGYHELIKGNHSFTTVNIDANYGCDLVFDIEKIFPLENESFDHIVCLNVLEHIFEFQNVVNESFRVLKKGGTMVIATPFLFQIHGSPDDYLRYTRSALEKMLQKAGFTEYKIEEMGNQIFSLNFQFFGGSLPGILRTIVKSFSVGCDKFLSRIVPRYKNIQKRMPLGYFTIVTK